MTGSQSGHIKLALSTMAFREKLLDYALDVASEVGVDGVEIWGREPHISEKFDENRVRTARKMVESRGLAIPVFSSYLSFGITRPRIDENIELAATLHTARCLNAPIVRVWASDLSSTKASATVWSRTIREIQEACDQAAKLGIVLAAEMHNGSLADTGRSARRLVETVERDNFRLNFRISAHIGPAEPPEERLELVLPYVVHVHAQNYARLVEGDHDTLQRAPVSSGIINYEGLIGRLIECGYDGYVALEYAHTEGDGKKQALFDDLNYLQSLGLSHTTGNKPSGVKTER